MFQMVSRFLFFYFEHQHELGIHCRELLGFLVVEAVGIVADKAVGTAVDMAVGIVADMVAESVQMVLVLRKGHGHQRDLYLQMVQ